MPVPTCSSLSARRRWARARRPACARWRRLWLPEQQVCDGDRLRGQAGQGHVLRPGGGRIHVPAGTWADELTLRARSGCRLTGRRPAPPAAARRTRVSGAARAGQTGGDLSGGTEQTWAACTVPGLEGGPLYRGAAQPPARTVECQPALPAGRTRPRAPRRCRARQLSSPRPAQARPAAARARRAAAPSPRPSLHRPAHPRRHQGGRTQRQHGMVRVPLLVERALLPGMPALNAAMTAAGLVSATNAGPRQNA